MRYAIGDHVHVRNPLYSASAYFGTVTDFVHNGFYDATSGRYADVYKINPAWCPSSECEWVTVDQITPIERVTRDGSQTIDVTGHESATVIILSSNDNANRVQEVMWNLSGPGRPYYGGAECFNMYFTCDQLPRPY